MGGTSSKNGLVKFDDTPKSYETENNLVWTPWITNGKRWYVNIYNSQYGTSQKEVTRIIIEKWINPHYRIEFAYQFRFVHTNRLKRPFVKRGVGIIRKVEPLDFIGFEEPLSPKYRVNFQVSVYALIDEQGNRRFNFHEPNLYGKSETIRGVEVPVESLHLRAPLLAARFEADKSVQKMDLLLQLVFGVHIQMEAKQIEPILKLAVKYKLHYVKRYCEQQMIWRFDLKFPGLQKYELACKYNLDLLMHQILVGLNSRRKLKKFALETIGIDKMNGKMMKLIAGKIFELA